MLTFAAIVETRHKLGNWEYVERTLAEAEKGYFILLRLFSNANRQTPERKQEFQAKFKHLRERLDGLKRLA